MNENENEIFKLFFAVAEFAIERGVEISLEKKGWKTDSNVMGGALSKSNTTDDGLVLRTYLPKEQEEQEAVESEESEEVEDE